MDAPAALLMARLGLSEDELLRVLDADPLSVVGAELDHRPELGILIALTTEAEEAVGLQVLRRWVRTAGPNGRPLDHLLERDFVAFEDDLTALQERGFVIRAPRGG